MARVLIIATHACEDPTRAGLAFVAAKGCVEAGHKPEILLAGDGALLARRALAESIAPVGFPPLKELIAFALDNNVPIHT